MGSANLQTSALGRIDVFGLSDRGRVREQNEDHFLVLAFGRHLEPLHTNLPASDAPPRFEETGYMMIVADGMGGVEGGAVASRMAIRSLVNVLLEVPDWILRPDGELAGRLMERAGAYYKKVDEILDAQAQADPRLAQMGTTLTVACCLGPNLFIAHVGDSRAYLWNDGRMTRLTRDQTIAQSLLESGALTAEQAAGHQWRKVLTDVIGKGPRVPKADVRQHLMANGNRLLLCTDGLTDMLNDEEMAAILGRAATSAEACRSLVDEALARGARDNVTVVVARFDAA